MSFRAETLARLKWAREVGSVTFFLAGRVHRQGVRGRLCKIASRAVAGATCTVGLMSGRT
jgi:hypothetical protein